MDHDISRRLRAVWTQIDTGRLPVWVAILIGLGFYGYHYATYGAVPGNTPAYPLGWWGWWDQSLYLKASADFWSGDLTAADQTYPPLYPLLGALLLPLSEMHSYLPLNAVLLGAYLWLFMRLFQRLLGGILSLLALGLSLFAYPLLSLQWAVPWTSSLAAVLGMGALVLFARYLTRYDDADWPLRARVVSALAAGLCVGFLAPTRPVDTVVFSLLLAAYAGHVLLVPGLWRDKVWVLAAGIVGFAVPVLGYLGFNTVLFGGPLSGYFDVAQNAGGAALSDLVDRTYSHLVDADTFYGEPVADWASEVPLLAMALCCVPVALIAGPLVMRVLALMVVVHMALVFSYSDAVPTGQFRYYNIHYFKWVYPILPAFGLYYLRSIWMATRSVRWRPALACAAWVAIVGCAIAIRPTYERIAPDQVTRVAPDQIEIDFGQTRVLDMIDIAGINGVIGHYNQFAQTVVLDGVAPLRPVGETRLTPIAGGMRMLMTDPVEARRVTLTLEGFGDLTQNDRLGVQGGDIRFGLAAPWSVRTPQSVFPPPAIEIGRLYRVGLEGDAARFLHAGWSGQEPWGRWMDGPLGEIVLSVPDPSAQGLMLVLETQAFLHPQAQPVVHVEVHVNDQAIGVLSRDTHEPRKMTFELPSALLGASGVIRVSLQAVSTLAPADINMNSDTRQLSVGLLNIGIMQ